MKNSLKYLAFLVLLITTNKLAAQPGLQVPANWELLLKYDSASNVYTVYGKPDTTFVGVNGWLFSASQVTVVLPDSMPDVPLVITPINFGGWQDQDDCFGGANASDYHAVYTFGANKAIKKDSLMPFFSFVLPGGCNKLVRLIRNSAETIVFALTTQTFPADLQDPCGTSSDYYNSISNGSILSVDAYALNIDNYGWGCNPALNAPLNVQLKNVEATTINCNTLISFESNAEKNVVGYAIVSGSNAKDYSQIGYLKATGSNSKYSFTTSSLLNKTNYFKIVAIDGSDNKLYSSSLKTTVLCNGSHQANIFPNPTADNITLQILSEGNAVNSTIIAQVFDMIGNKVLTQSAILANGKAVINFDVQTLPEGNYLVRYQNATGKYDGVLKFTKVPKN